MTRTALTFLLAFSFFGSSPMLASTTPQINHALLESIVTGADSTITSPSPIPTPEPTIAPIKRIDVDLSDQTLSYYYGDELVNTIKISSGVAALPTPTGTFFVLAKIPVKDYVGKNLDGTTYNFPDTQWNLKFSPLGYYIHGAYWNHDMGTPHSHGCINVSYADMPELYAFADVGTQITIHK